MKTNENKMVKDILVGTLLPNNYIDIFKSDKLLTLNNINIIARSSDGYINLNQLCKAAGKEFYEWKKNKKSKAFIEVLSSSRGFPRVDLIKYESGGNGERHNWGHPQVAINVAQWVSPEFDVKVSKFVFELMLFGKVEIGKEKTNKELENKLQQEIKNLKNENFLLTKKYNSQMKKHHFHKFKQNGPSFYVIVEGLEYADNIIRIKIGICGCTKRRIQQCPHCNEVLEENRDHESIDLRLNDHRILWPRLIIHFLVYTNDAELLEKCIKRLYKKQINPNGHEIIEGIQVEEVIQNTKNYLKLFNTFSDNDEFTIENNIDLYNKNTLKIIKNNIIENKIIYIEEKNPKKIEKVVEVKKVEDEVDEEKVEEEVDEEVDEEKVEEEVDEELDEEKVEKEVDEELDKEEVDEEEMKKILSKINSYTVKELKEKLEKYGQNKKGLKPELKENLIKYLESNIKRICDKCNCNILLENYRRHGFGNKKTCVDCDLKSCEYKIEERIDVKTEITDEMETCQCSKCKHVLSVNDFHKNKSNRTGHESACINCRAKGKNKARNGGELKPMKLIKVKPEVENNEKFCSICEIVKPKEEYRKATGRKDGCQSYCRLCENERLKKRRMKNKINNLK
jgi:hypothetical protein